VDRDPADHADTRGPGLQVHVLAALSVAVPAPGHVAVAVHLACGRDRRIRHAAGRHGSRLHRDAGVPAGEHPDRLPRVPGSPRPDTSRARTRTARRVPDHDRPGPGADRSGRADPASRARDRLRRPAGLLAAGRGRLRRGQADVRRAGRASLQPQGPGLPRPRDRHVCQQDQARQSQSLALGACRRLRPDHVRRPRSRTAPDHGRADAGLFPRSGGRLRRRAPVLRQHREPDHPLGRVGAVPVPQRHPASGQPPSLSHAGRHECCSADQRHPAGLCRLHH
jgi:hypothetical protein